VRRRDRAKPYLVKALTIAMLSKVPWDGHGWFGIRSRASR
jgi:hypothetical protein